MERGRNGKIFYIFFHFRRLCAGFFEINFAFSRRGSPEVGRKGGSFRRVSQNSPLSQWRGLRRMDFSATLYLTVFSGIYMTGEIFLIESKAEFLHINSELKNRPVTFLALPIMFHFLAIVYLQKLREAISKRGKGYL